MLARWRRLGRALQPYAIAASAIPIIAFAPITNAWFGPFGKTSKMAIAAVLCFFPVFVNTIRGLTSVRPSSIELMRSYAAGEIDIFRRVRFPTALPFIFTALKIATVLAMIGAIVGEYFGGSPEALGVLINSRNATFDFEEAWAGIGVACAFGIAFYLAVAAPRTPGTPGRAVDRGLKMGHNRPVSGRSTKGGRMSRKLWVWAVGVLVIAGMLAVCRRARRRGSRARRS